MKEPTSEADVQELHRILQTDPQRYLQITNAWLSEDPLNVKALWNRHLGWMELGEPRKALEDLNTALAIEPDALRYISRAEVFRHLGEYQKALDDFATSEALIPDEWEDLGFGLLQQADCHARLGEEDKALECCARLPDDFWTPGLNDAPAGDKAGIAARLKLIANEARRGGGG